MSYSQENRTRAWFFIKVSSGANPDTVAKDIYDTYGGTKGQNHYVLVRADVVSGCALGEIIASVDSIDKAINNFKGITKAERDIKKVTGVASASKAIVASHYPHPPHEAYGYVNEAEKIKGQQSKPKPVKDVTIAGLQSPYSPGSNKWG